METQAIEIIETEVILDKSTSLNHSRLTSRITWLLSAAYEDKDEDEYDVLPELDIELSTGRAKSDVALIPKQVYNWRENIIAFPHAPITAIEILSPTQSLDALAGKIDKIYLAGGVQSAWLAVPFLKTVHVFLPDGTINTFATGALHDPASGVELALEAIFR